MFGTWYLTIWLHIIESKIMKETYSSTDWKMEIILYKLKNEKLDYEGKVYSSECQAYPSIQLTILFYLYYIQFHLYQEPTRPIRIKLGTTARLSVW